MFLHCHKGGIKTLLILSRYGRFPPNTPSVMRGTLPTEEDRGKVTEKRILKSLPTPMVAFKALAIAQVMIMSLDLDGTTKTAQPVLASSLDQADTIIQTGNTDVP